MSDPFIGEIKMVGFNFAPRGWALCQGQLMGIAQNTALFSLLGTTFGGNGQVTFGLPDYRSRSPVGMGTGPGLSTIVQGEMAGAEQANILISNMPVHNHSLTVGATAATPVAVPSNTNNVLAASGSGPGTATIWSTTLSSPVTVNPSQIGVSGGSQPLPIRNPYLGTNFIIALEGIFPSRD